MAITFMEKQKNALLKKFHGLLAKGQMGNEDKLDLLSAYGVQSSKDLTVYELTELCGKLDRIINPQVAESDKLRKRLIATIFSYRQAMGSQPSMDEVKGIACRAAKVENFNRISDDRLRSLYNAFNRMKKDLNNVREMTEAQIKELQTLN